jgi:hypothetical protein
VPPTSVRLTRRALEGGPAEPSNVFPVTTQGYDVTSGRRERPSPSLSIPCGYPRHCSATPRTATTSPTLLERTRTGHRHNHHCTGPRGRPPRAGSRTTVGQPTAAPPPLKPLLYEHRTHHDATTGTRFARTVVNSMALLAMPPHVGE